MTIHLKLLLVAILAATPMTAALGHDQGKSAMKALIAEQFAAADADGDGQVSRSEIYDERKSRFATTDSNNDGAISATELDTALAVWRLPRLTKRLALMDTDGNGSVDIEEFARHDRWLHRLDKNHDGAIDRDEIKSAGRHFKHHKSCHHGRRHRN